MHSVVETHAFRRAARGAGMTEDDIATLVDILANNPEAGDEIAGTGGCRKLRLAGKGKGKSGGYRSVTFYSGGAIPVFLITVFAKGDRANLTKAECNALSDITKKLVEAYRPKPSRPGEHR
jgi:hypothetical protein